MNNGKYVFSQIISFLPKRSFDWIVDRYDGNRYVKHFTCWNQLLCMMYGQMSNAESLSDLLIVLSSHKKKFFHLGIGKNVSKSNLANSNQKRDCKIFEEFAYHLISEAQKIITNDDEFLSNIEGSIYAFDSTVIDLCLNVFWWAEFRKAKGGIKIHTMLDIKTNIPVFISISEAALHDVNGLDQFKIESGGYYILDKAYLDFDRLYRMNMCSAYFITRTKKNIQFVRLLSNKIKKKKGVRCDQTISLKGFYSGKYYPENLRRIKFFDKTTQKRLTFLTNNFELEAHEIAKLYKYRWRIELFFKWIKQHLKIKAFWGTTLNAVKTQVYVAISTYVLIAIIKRKTKTTFTNYETLRILSHSLLDKTTIRELLEKPLEQDFKEQNAKQLKINLI